MPTSLKMFNCFIERLLLHQTQPQKEVTFDQIRIHIESTTTVGARCIELLHLDEAQSSVGEVGRVVWILYLRGRGKENVINMFKCRAIQLNLSALINSN